MISTVITISVRRLLHNPVELLLTFVVPVVFFSVFALIFGSGIGIGRTPKVKVAIATTDHNDSSRSLAEALADSDGLRVLALENGDKTQGKKKHPVQQDINRVTDAVRKGTVAIGILIGRDKSGSLKAELLTDASDQVAPQVVSAIVSREIAIAEARFAQMNGESLLVRKPSVEHPSADNSEGSQVERATFRDSDIGDRMLPTESVSIIDVMSDGKSNPVVSLYAAGIAVMFLLFGASGGGGVLLEERENTTLDRLLSSQLTMDQLLLGKWFYLTLLGFVQVTVMFLWGQIVFGIDLLGHLDGFIMMTLVTSGAAAAFGLFLATLCKTRGQLNGLSVIMILTMSALGGSMVPRYVMSEKMREMGLWTFNAWALDGYDKVFWRELPVESLWPQLAVLMGCGVAFLLVARALAVRWEFN
ncbi:ABC transporter permease [Roseiconus lacunae]|uniref:ABC transporter permease n=1 Tax=Roseiconus lacunae TaxID=2605694 RepID=UPI0030858258|nr:ABC transporter permease [Stieleria sp. HD01]